MKTGRRVALLIGLALFVGAIAGPAGADGWDVGDGSGFCNTYEICLFDWQSSTDRTAQFYWSETRYLWGSGSVRTWWHVPTSSYSLKQVYDTVSRVRNRDSSCGVRFYEDSFYNGAAIYIPNNSAYYDVPAWMDIDQGGANGISSHLRTNCS